MEGRAVPAERRAACTQAERRALLPGELIQAPWLDTQLSGAQLQMSVVTVLPKPC